MDVDTFGSAPGLWRTWAGVVLLALANGCTAAPIAGKPCPCAPADVYVCCETLQTCMADLKQCPPPTPPPPAPCNSAKISSPIVTGNGLPPPMPDTTDAGVPQLKFGYQPEQWVSFAFYGMGETKPIVSASADGNGIDVVATFGSGVSPTDAYEAVGLSFAGDHCVDGTDLQGVQFDFDGDLGGRKLEVGVSSSEDIDTMFPPGTCTAGDMKCYGPTKPIDPMIGTNYVRFTELMKGMPSETLDASRIVNVQWELHDAVNPMARFTIKNIMFFSGLPPRDGG